MYIFSHFWSSKPWIWIRITKTAGSGSALKQVPIRNTEINFSSSAFFKRQDSHPGSARRLDPESIECFLEKQAFMLSYNLAPPPSLLQSLFSCVSPVELTYGRRSEEPSHRTAGKPGPLLIIHYSMIGSIFSRYGLPTSKNNNRPS